MTELRAWAHGDPDAVIKSVLAGREYHHAPVTGTDSPQLRFWYEFWNWIEHLFRPFTNWLKHVFESTSGAMTPLSILVIAASVLALVSVIMRIALAFARPGDGRSARAALGGALGAPKDADAWRRAAAEAAARGEYAGAIAALFAAALAALDEWALVPYDDSRTPGEYRRRVRAARAPAAPAFDVLAERFVHAAYAADPTSRAEYDSALDAYARFVPLCGAS